MNKLVTESDIMISIIICSRTADISQELKDNISTTIGCDYELCVIDNSRGDYNIFTAYNEGVRRAKGDILCFMHEDVVFRCEDWGGAVKNAYSHDPKIGCIGVVGSQVLTRKPLPWWLVSPKMGGLWQGKQEIDGTYTVNEDYGNRVEKLTEVVILDGCLLCIRRKLFESIRWDDTTFDKFHAYDLDICLQVIKEGYKVCIMPNVTIEHKSLGSVDEIYYEQLAKFYNKWNDILPIYRGVELTDTDLKWREYILQYIIEAKRLTNKLNSAYNSKAYKLGSLLLKPLRWLKK